MRNDYYNSRWARVSRPLQGSRETPAGTEPYGQVPPQTGQPAAPAPVRPGTGGANRTPDVWRKRSRPRRKKGEKSGLPGFLCCLVLLLGLTGLAVYFQGGPLPAAELWETVQDIWNGAYQWPGENLPPWESGEDDRPGEDSPPWSGDWSQEEDDDWIEELPNTTVRRAPLGDGTTLTLAGAAGRRLTPQEIYEKVNPSVVSVQALMSSGMMGQGSGVIMSSDGYILTNAHVIAGSFLLEVLFSDGTRSEALLVGYDGAADLAVLKVDRKGLPVADFGDSGALRVGDPAYAIGNPLGEELRGTMTDGIISAIDRVVSAGNGEMTLLQTTAALNPGNSGGALVNAAGQVVGITNMKMMAYEDEVYEGLGFAIPTAIAKEVVDQIIDRGYYDDGVPLLGITVMTQVSDGEVPAGAYVYTVEPGSDAHKKGIRPGDIITGANGAPITSTEDLLAAKAGLSAGDVLVLQVWRNGRERTVKIVLMTRHQMDGKK